jgi:exosome complex protein LRP1
LKLEGSDTQTQAVLTELKRIQQYFGKIKNIEAPPAEESRSMTVNQEAAARILKADLVRSPYEMTKTFQLTHQTV